MQAPRDRRHRSHRDTRRPGRRPPRRRRDVRLRLVVRDAGRAPVSPARRSSGEPRRVRRPGGLRAALTAWTRCTSCRPPRPRTACAAPGRRRRRGGRGRAADRLHVVPGRAARRRSSPWSASTRATEEAIRATGVRHTFLRSNMYADFVPFFATVEDGAAVIAAPAGDGRTGFVSRDDLADVAAAVLLDDSAASTGRPWRSPARRRCRWPRPRRAHRGHRPARGVPGADGRGGVGDPPPLGAPRLGDRGLGDQLPGDRRGRAVRPSPTSSPPWTGPPGPDRGRAPARPPRGLGAPPIRPRISVAMAQTVVPRRPAGPRAAPTSRAPRRRQLAGFTSPGRRSAGAAGRSSPGSSTSPPRPRRAWLIDAEEMEVGVRLRRPQPQMTPMAAPTRRRGRTHERGHQSRRGGATPAVPSAGPGHRHIATATGRGRRRRRGPAARYCSANSPKARAGVRARVVVGEEPAHQRSSTKALASSVRASTVVSSSMVHPLECVRTPTAPSIPSRIRSAWPLCRAYSWIEVHHHPAQRVLVPRRRSTPVTSRDGARPRCRR